MCLRVSWIVPDLGSETVAVAGISPLSAGTTGSKGPSTVTTLVGQSLSDWNVSINNLILMVGGF